MKKITLLLAIQFVFLCKIQAQEVEKDFVPYYVKDGNVESFERKGAKIEAKAIGFGYGGVNQYLTIFNSKYSDVRFKSGDTPKFIMSLEEGTDPLDLVIITKADVVKKRKKYRRFIQKGNSMGGGNKDISQHLIFPELKKIEGNLYEIILPASLSPGEYAFQPIYKGKEANNIMATSGAVRIYCFGIDG
ncbi:hypothetical protein [Aquimarina sp. 2201CG14-23]|uniref:hypothetical protein n=1 Tax=Aquimarina mycalae TaxID=3040073 RepID=UPI002477FDDC|nr:hypothetical protein [Aquimarina sp. 2201CG14-23]MDH7444832.1 hypothetical protein [Aquimarina sp. 2201CG14-23]